MFGTVRKSLLIRRPQALSRVKEIVQSTAPVCFVDTSQSCVGSKAVAGWQLRRAKAATNRALGHWKHRNGNDGC